MKSPHDILVGPVVTEKATLVRALDKYVFEVDPKANKVEVRKAVEAVFPGVQVASVNTLRVRGKVKRQGRTSGRRPMRKKAIVTLREGSAPITAFDV
ncbi:50S ribosomal protein L23 [Pasteuria penetrans]|uniref:50S ribosomal protein L23 n=1 Tax=Pasteuria penetrans TaxID=86005 RepID=UPI000F952314|nr:50S ribosomal protein L23 [Pasteuria penetrans]